MLALKLTAALEPDHTFVLSMPPEVPPGLYEIVVVLSKKQESDANGGPAVSQALGEENLLVLPVHDVGPWPQELSLSREDLYHEWSR